MKIEFSNNQYKDGVFVNPFIQLKTFTITCNDDEFLNYYLFQLGIAQRHLKFYKFILTHMDKGRGFSLRDHEESLKKAGFPYGSATTYISELHKTNSKTGPKVIKKINNGVWQIPRDIVFPFKGIFGDGKFEDCEIKINIVRE